jgi:uncharacterized protein (DUF2336 family)
MPHNAASPTQATDPAIASPLSLIDELEDAIAKQNMRQRAAVMRRVTDLFMVSGAGFSEEHIAMFDDVLGRLVSAIDTSARAELGERLARCPTAPLATSRILALDDAIGVAGPLLTHSERIDQQTLIEGAKTKSQDHLMAISKRSTISEAVTDVLVERGNTEVVANAAANPGARFSELGCIALVRRSHESGDIAQRVWARPDIPRHHLLSLFAAASEEVQKQLETADRQKAELYRYMVAQAKNQVQTQIREGSESYTTARPYVESLNRSGELNQGRLQTFANEGKFDEVVIALALMSQLSVGHVERAFVHDQADHLLVIAKAIGLSWETTKAILQLRLSTDSNSHRDLDLHHASFVKLQQSTATSALQFYRLRARAEAQLESLT